MTGVICIFMTPVMDTNCQRQYKEKGAYVIIEK